MTDPLTLTAAFILGTIAVARATRLATSDGYPPAIAVRRWWWNQTIAKGDWRAGWAKLLVGHHPEDPGCPFCFAPYAAAVNLAWVLAAGVGWDGFWSQAWWVVNLWAAGSYLSAAFVVRDEPPMED